MLLRILVVLLAAVPSHSFVVDVSAGHRSGQKSFHGPLKATQSEDANREDFSSRRNFLVSSAVVGMALMAPPTGVEQAEAIGPVKIELVNPKYTASICPKVSQALLRSKACNIRSS